MDSARRRKNSLGRDDHISFERHMWGVQRASWACVVLVLVAGLAGAFGRGALSAALATTADGMMSVSYERFLRHHAPTELHFRIRRNAGGDVRLWVARDCFNTLRVEQISPQPKAVTAQDDGLVYTFAYAGEGVLAVCFRLDVETLSSVDGAVGIPGEVQRLEFRQYVYP